VGKVIVMFYLGCGTGPYGLTHFDGCTHNMGLRRDDYIILIYTTIIC